VFENFETEDEFMMTALQGIIAAGTAAYLTREATCEKMALTSNHLFYLVGIASHAAAVEIPHFSLAAKAVFMMTPIAILEHFHQGQESTPKTVAIGYYFNRFYYAAAVVSTVVLVAFGHTAYGVGFFSVVALDMISRSEKVHEYIKTAFEWSANGTALLTFASYAAKLETPIGQCLIGGVAMLVFAPRVCKVIQTMLPDSPSTSDKRKRKEPKYNGFTPYAAMSIGLVPSLPTKRVEPGVYMKGLQNLTGKLPHDL
jgi:hypothetical protein